MSSSSIFKKLSAKYKPIERLFLRADKREKANYIKLKYEFRITLAVSLLLLLISLAVLVVQRQFLPAPYLMLASILIGFRYKWYNLPRATLFLAMAIIPVGDIRNELLLLVPTTVMFTNIILFILTQSEAYTLAHLIIQTVAMYFYGTEKIIQTIKSMTPEEIAKIAQTAITIGLVATWVNWIAMGRFYTHVSNLLRKINGLWGDISKANSQLNDQNHKLQDNLEMKDVFIYTFSHELKNALNGLLGNLSLAYEAAPKDSQMTKLLTSSKVCGEVLKNFIHNILDSGKLENGNLEVAPERKDVMSFMEHVWTICGRIIENKRLQGYLEIAKNVPRYLELDEQRMIQIILNLVSNACKFTEKGHVRIQVSWEKHPAIKTQLEPQEALTTPADENGQDAEASQEEGESELYGDLREYRDTSELSLLDREKLHLVTERQKRFINDPLFYQLNLSKWQWNREESLPSEFTIGNKGVLKIQVLDTGCGMNEEDQALLFRKFSQTNRIAGQRKVGTGLGLWICKELASRLNGDIKTRSTTGMGSVFELAIRTTVSNFIIKSPSQLSLNADSGSAQSKSIAKPRRVNTKKILVADDDSFNVELMKHYLNKFEIGYFCAYDGEEAVALFKKHYEEICFVITDNFMPKKTGTEAAIEIDHFLKEMRKPKIPIMCISGDVKVNVGETGITSVIQKPINFDRLKAELIIIYPHINCQ